MSEVKKIKVRNNCSHEVGYTLTNSGITRNFLPKQTLPIKLEEIEEAMYYPGAMLLFTSGLLAVDDFQERVLCGLAIEEDGKVVEDIKGIYSKEQIVTALKSDKLIDLVMILKDGASATKDMVVDLALELEILDGKKNAEIKRYTGKDIIEIYQNRRRLEEETEVK